MLCLLYSQCLKQGRRVSPSNGEWQKVRRRPGLAWPQAQECGSRPLGAQRIPGWLDLPTIIKARCLSDWWVVSFPRKRKLVVMLYLAPGRTVFSSRHAIGTISKREQTERQRLWKQVLRTTADGEPGKLVEQNNYLQNIWRFALQYNSINIYWGTSMWTIPGGMHEYWSETVPVLWDRDFNLMQVGEVRNN